MKLPKILTRFKTARLRRKNTRRIAETEVAKELHQYSTEDLKRIGGRITHELRGSRFVPGTVEEGKKVLVQGRIELRLKEAARLKKQRKQKMNRRK